MTSKSSDGDTPFLVPNNKKNVAYIDLGANVGRTARSFIKNLDTKNPPNFCCHLFEPVPENFERLKSKVTDAYPAAPVFFYEKAAWDSFGKTRMLVGIKNNLTDSRLETVIDYKDKALKRRNRKNIIEVGCVDISEWIKKNIYDKFDFVIIKMDIEGSEYAILDKMMSSGTIDCVDRLIIEFHDTEIHKNNKRARREYCGKIKNLNPEIQIYYEARGTYNHWN